MQSLVFRFHRPVLRCLPCFSVRAYSAFALPRIPPRNALPSIFVRRFKSKGYKRRKFELEQARNQLDSAYSLQSEGKTDESLNLYDTSISVFRNYLERRTPSQHSSSSPSSPPPSSPSITRTELGDGVQMEVSQEDNVEDEDEVNIDVDVDDSKRLIDKEYLGRSEARELAIALCNSAEVLASLKRYDEAAARAREAIAILESGIVDGQTDDNATQSKREWTISENDEVLGVLNGNVAEYYSSLNNYPAALPFARRAADIFLGAHGISDDNTAHYVMQLYRALQQVGKTDELTELKDKYADILQDRLGIREDLEERSKKMIEELENRLVDENQDINIDDIVNQSKSEDESMQPTVTIDIPGQGIESEGPAIPFIESESAFQSPEEKGGNLDDIFQQQEEPEEEKQEDGKQKEESTPKEPFDESKLSPDDPVMKEALAKLGNLAKKHDAIRKQKLAGVDSEEDLLGETIETMDSLLNKRFGEIPVDAEDERAFKSHDSKAAEQMIAKMSVAVQDLVDKQKIAIENLQQSMMAEDDTPEQQQDYKNMEDEDDMFLDDFDDEEQPTKRTPRTRRRKK